MTTWLPATCPLPCPPLEVERGCDDPDGPRVAGNSLKPGLAEASVPTPPGMLGPLGQTWSVQYFCWSGPVKWRTVRAVMLTARPAATTTPSPAANVGVNTSLRSAGPTCTPLDRAASDTSTRGDSARACPAPGHPIPDHSTAGSSAVGRSASGCPSPGCRSPGRPSPSRPAPGCPAPGCPAPGRSA